LPDQRIVSGTGDHDVEIQLPGFHALGEIFHADDVRPASSPPGPCPPCAQHAIRIFLPFRPEARPIHARVWSISSRRAQIDRHVDRFSSNLATAACLIDLQRVEHG